MRAAYVASFALLSLAVSEGCRGGDAPQCQQGAERCPCYPNGTCNTGLTCLSAVCVQASGGTGGSSQGGTMGSGGADPGGSGGTVSGSGGGGASGSGGGGISGSGGGGGMVSDAAADSATCGDTQTDPKNCGQCGRVCKNTNPIFEDECPSGGCCQAGKCMPYFGACIMETDAFSTCGAYCNSIGESCVQKGCVGGNVTSVAWGLGSAAGCAAYRNIHSKDVMPCDAPVDWGIPVNVVRCCCTDTHP
jgi:hypothetical protein